MLSLVYLRWLPGFVLDLLSDLLVVRFELRGLFTGEGVVLSYWLDLVCGLMGFCYCS